MIIDPAPYPTSSARHCLARWLNAWSSHDWPAMAALSQLTWTSVQADAPAWLRDWYGGKTPQEATIEHTAPFGDSTADIAVTIAYTSRGGRVERRIVARVIRETAPYEPAPRIGIAGRWGVNPISALREEDAR